MLSGGLSNAKMICNALDNEAENIISATCDELATIEGVGDVIARSFTDYFENENNRVEFNKLISLLTIIKPEKIEGNDNVSGKTFVITGSLNGYENVLNLRIKLLIMIVFRNFYSYPVIQ